MGAEDLVGKREQARGLRDGGWRLVDTGGDQRCCMWHRLSRSIQIKILLVKRPLQHAFDHIVHSL